MVTLEKRLATSLGLSEASTATRKLLRKAFLGADVSEEAQKHGKKPSRVHQLLSRRREIINRQLCDDAIAYLAPSLEPYKGTTIIDINPGACIWSRSLHTFLQPKRHVLLEPEKRYFEPFIKPLLEQRGSSYTHIPLAGAAERSYWDNWRTILKGSEAMPARPSLHPTDPRLKQLDKSLLITGNLWRLMLSKGSLPYNLASMIIAQTSWAAHTNELFHNAGRVRMLWWLPETEMRNIISQDSMSRTALSSGIELTSDVNFVVGCNPLAEINKARGEINQRGPEIEHAIAMNVRGRMADQRLTAPPGRELASVSNVQQPSDIRYSNPLQTSCRTCDDLEQLLTSFEQERKEALSLVQSMRKRKQRPSTAEYRDAAESQVVYKQCVEEIFTRPKRFYQTKWGLLLQVTLSVDLLLQAAHLEAEWHQLSKALPKDAERLTLLRQRITKARCSYGDYKTPALRLIDRKNIRAHANHLVLQHAKPQPILHDLRPYEPIKADPTDFWPAKEMALIDVIPRDIDLGVAGIANASEGANTCRELLKHVWTIGSRSLGESLEGLAPNARKDLMPALEELADPQQGGNIDPEDVMVQNVHRDTFVKLTRALLEWPFRPELGHMAMVSEESAETDESITAAVEEEEDLQEQPAASG